ncbi:putative fluoride ion transporter CrcB [Dioscorea sansibarensis]
MDFPKAQSLATSRSSSMRAPSRDVSDLIRDSFTLSRDLVEEVLGDIDGSVIAQAGDSGSRVADDLAAEKNEQLELFSLNNGEANGKLAASPLPTDAILHSGLTNQIEINRSSSSLKEKKDKLPGGLDHVSYLIHLAVFGILGLFTSYLLQKLLGPGLVKLTGDVSELYPALLPVIACLILGSFFMAWFGVIFRADIRDISDHLVIGLTTGYLGSLSTFSGLIMNMLDLSVRGHWVFAIGLIALGLGIMNESMRYGLETAEVLRRCILNWHYKSSRKTKIMLENLRVNTYNRRILVLISMIMIYIILWSLSCILAKRKLDSVTNGAVLWLACLVGPPGVWIRWYLARLNGRGIGRKGILKWLPTGTLIVNVLASCIMAALSTITKEVNTKRCQIIARGIQFGFVGSLSTIAAFAAEIFAMRQNGHFLRANAYMLLTVIPSFGLGTLIYSLPVWLKRYNN